MRTLILAPHMDDECLGCSSFLVEGCSVLYTTQTHPLNPEVFEENQKLQRLVGFKAYWTQFDRINELDLVGQRTLIAAFEAALEVIKPHTVLVPAPSYNQDHRASYEGMLTACRPHDLNWFVKRILVYEEPETLGSMRRDLDFRPTFFMPCDIERKIRLYSTYASQVRGHRTPDQIQALAAVRGIQSNLLYAEAFEVARWVA
jgi:LmbE family N-acetylglucosaminyl deacetylase